MGQMKAVFTLARQPARAAVCCHSPKTVCPHIGVFFYGSLGADFRQPGHIHLSLPGRTHTTSSMHHAPEYPFQVLQQFTRTGLSGSQ